MKPPARGRAGGLLARSIAGSLLVHGALLASSASVPAASAATLDVTPLAPPSESETLLVALHPGLDLIWSPPPPVAACFDANVIDAMRDRYQVGWSEYFEWSPVKLGAWTDISSSAWVIRGVDPRVDLTRELFDECAVATSLAGVDPAVRHEVRGRRGEDGLAQVSVSAAYGLDLDERVRCCLVKTAEMVVPTLHPGDELRYDGGPHGRGGTLVRANIQ